MNSQQVFNLYSIYVVLTFAQSLLAWELGRKKNICIIMEGPRRNIKFAFFLYFIMVLWYFIGKLDFPITKLRDAWPLLINLAVYLLARIIPPNSEVTKHNSFLEAKELYYSYLRARSINELMSEEEINDAKSSESLTRADMLFRSAIDILQKSPKSEATLNDLGIALYQLGILLRLQGKYDEATNTLAAAHKNLEALKPNENRLISLSGCYYNLGLINECEGRNENATEYYKKSLRIDRKINDEDGIEMVNNAIDRCNR